MDISIQKLSKDELTQKGVFQWPIWEKEESRFDWHYESIEQCYFLEGKVMVKTKDGRSVSFGAGDFVTFPQGLVCTWFVERKVRKHYNFT
ncbi:MAG: cupin domain-containing protein [Chitinivibrionales bacterium]|nr:cupin domain-containing protein [Chitinivibrionales bacterium]